MRALCPQLIHPFHDTVVDVTELVMCLGADKKMAVLQAFNFSLATMATVLICFVTLLAYSLIPGNPPLVPSTVRPPKPSA